MEKAEEEALVRELVWIIRRFLQQTTSRHNIVTQARSPMIETGISEDLDEFFGKIQEDKDKANIALLSLAELCDFKGHQISIKSFQSLVLFDVSNETSVALNAILTLDIREVISMINRIIYPNSSFQSTSYGDSEFSYASAIGVHGGYSAVGRPVQSSITSAPPAQSEFLNSYDDKDRAKPT